MVHKALIVKLLVALPETISLPPRLRFVWWRYHSRPSFPDFYENVKYETKINRVKTPLGEGASNNMTINNWDWDEKIDTIPMNYALNVFETNC